VISVSMPSGVEHASAHGYDLESWKGDLRLDAFGR